MQVIFVYADSRGNKNQVFNLTRELSDAEVSALLASDELVYALSHGSNSKTSTRVKVLGKQFDVYDEKPRLNVYVQQIDENERSASAFFM